MLGPERCISESELFEAARREGLDNSVGRRHEPSEEFAPLPRGEVEGHGPFTDIQDEPPQTCVRRLSVMEPWADAAHRIALRGLDLDDVGSNPGEYPTAEPTLFAC
jgi:hypothetical protein